MLDRRGSTIMTDDGRKELELRIAGAGLPGWEAAVEAAIRDLDPDAHARLDAATGIVHVTTRCEALDLTDAITRAGFDATAMTG
jgi:copper chaperone